MPWSQTSERTRIIRSLAATRSPLRILSKASRPCLLTRRWRGPVPPWLWAHSLGFLILIPIVMPP